MSAFERLCEDLNALETPDPERGIVGVNVADLAKAIAVVEASRCVLSGADQDHKKLGAALMDLGVSITPPRTDGKTKLAESVRDATWEAAARVAEAYKGGPPLTRELIAVEIADAIRNLKTKAE